MNRSQTIATLYKLSFQTPKGHSLRQACLIAMGKVRIASDAKVETVVEDLAEASKDVQNEAKLNLVAELAVETVEQHEKKLAPKGLNAIKSWIKKHSVTFQKLQDNAFAVASSPVTAVGVAFKIIDEKLNKAKSGGDIVGTISFIASVLNAKSVEDLVEAESTEWNKFKPHLPSFLGLGAVAIEEHWLDIQKYALKYGYEALHAVEMWLHGASWLKVLGAVVGSFVAIMVICLLFGTHNVYMLLKKAAALVFGLPLAVLNDAISALKWGYNKIKGIFDDAGAKLKKWWEEEEETVVNKTASRLVIREFKKLAMEDDRFYRLASQTFAL